MCGWLPVRHGRERAICACRERCSAFTYVLFPALGLLLRALAPGLLSDELYTGLLLLCALPSTVQSSIAFTSIARGNVAAALTAASLSNLLGVLVTPLLLGVLLRREGVGFSTSVIQKLALELLLPFALGQLLRPRVGGLGDATQADLGLCRPRLDPARGVRSIQ